MPTLYADLVDFKQWLESDPHDPQDTLDDELLETCLAAASEDITIATGRTFAPLTDVRYYGSRDGRELVIHDIADVTDLAIATDDDGDGAYETTWDAADFALDPPNALLTEDAYTRIIATGSKTFPIAIRGTRIGATFGLTVDGKAPALIHMATLVGAHRWLNRRNNPYGTETALDAQGTASIRQIKADYDYDRAISRYRRESPVILLSVSNVTPTRPHLFTIAKGYRGR